MQKCSMWKPEPNNKNCLQDCPQWRDSRKKQNIQSDIRHVELDSNNKTLSTRKKYNIQGSIRTLLGKDCEVERMMRFLRERGLFEKV